MKVFGLDLIPEYLDKWWWIGTICWVILLGKVRDKYNLSFWKHTGLCLIVGMAFALFWDWTHGRL